MSAIENTVTGEVITSRLFAFFFFFCFLGPHLLHVEVPRLGVKSELQLPAYTIATAMRDVSHICDRPPQSTATLDT